jgi:hypothetical protein
VTLGEGHDAPNGAKGGGSEHGVAARHCVHRDRVRSGAQYHRIGHDERRGTRRWSEREHALSEEWTPEPHDYD